jgi:hypothetical protein
MTARTGDIVSEQIPNDSTFTRGQRTRLTLIAVAAYGLGALARDGLSVFADVGHGASLLADPASALAMTKAVVVILLVGVLGTIAGRTVRPDVGLFAAAISLLALRRVGGPTREVYLVAPTSGTLWLLAIESVLLAGALFAVFFFARRLVASGFVLDDAAADHIHVEQEPVGQRWLAFATQGLVVLVLMSVLCRTDERMQVAGTLAISASLASLCTVRFIPATPSVYFWLAPLGLSVLGYIATAVSGTANLSIGEPAGFFKSVAMALPLDFASAGVAGSLYGYWVGRTMIPEEFRATNVTPATA